MRRIEMAVQGLEKKGVRGVRGNEREQDGRSMNLVNIESISILPGSSSCRVWTSHKFLSDSFHRKHKRQRQSQRLLKVFSIEN